MSNSISSVSIVPWCFHCGQEAALLTFELVTQDNQIVRLTTDGPVQVGETGKIVLRPKTDQQGLKEVVITVTVTVDVTE